MSFSFNIREADKAAAKTAITTKLDEVVAQQPIHGVDRAGIEAAAHAYVDVLRDDDDQDVNVTISGSCYRTGTGEVTDPVDGASLSVNASLARRETQS